MPIFTVPEELQPLVGAVSDKLTSRMNRMQIMAGMVPSAAQIDYTKNAMLTFVTQVVDAIVCEGFEIKKKEDADAM